MSYSENFKKLESRGDTGFVYCAMSGQSDLITKYELENVVQLKFPVVCRVHDTDKPSVVKVVVALIAEHTCIDPITAKKIRKEAKYNVLCADSSVWEHISDDPA